MYKELIQIIEKNIYSLKGQLKVTDAQLIWGGQTVKIKYNKIKQRLLNKLKEETFYQEYYENKGNEEVIDTQNLYKRLQRLNLTVS